MKVTVGKKTKQVLLKRNLYSELVNETSRMDNSFENYKNIENLLNKLDSGLLKEYMIIYTFPHESTDVNLSLRKKS
ncbi:hypothetical protein A3K64_00225 [Candidatus Micrarchaeota archaeon RBG_16_36_9]|nr:MAG: hypothetical protein A3K64_00225 [Candidatus Micrarchaeota archaeon RBG_16_36_9]